MNDQEVVAFRNAVYSIVNEILDELYETKKETRSN